MSLFDTVTSKWRPPTLRQGTNYPFWSPDGAWVYFTNVGDSGLSRVRVSDGRVEELGAIPVTPGYDECSGRGFVPGGTMLLKCDDSRKDIFALDYEEQK